MGTLAITTLVGVIDGPFRFGFFFIDVVTDVVDDLGLIGLLAIVSGVVRRRSLAEVGDEQLGIDTGCHLRLGRLGEGPTAEQVHETDGRGEQGEYEGHEQGTELHGWSFDQVGGDPILTTVEPPYCRLGYT